jgi:LmbE family N-acetylglucosaminyl deacetylase
VIAHEEVAIRRRLFVSPFRPVTRRRELVILSPHLDDATIDCFSLFKRRPIVVNVFTGIPPRGTLSDWDRLCGAADSSEWMKRRLAEDRAALGEYAGEIVGLGVLEHAYRGCATTARALDAVKHALRGHASALSRASEIYAPLAGGNRPHPDHRVVREAARWLGRELDRPVLLYADVPYCVTSGSWPRFLVPGGVDKARWWCRVVRQVPEMVSLARARRVRLSRRRCSAKLATMRSYRTQFDVLNQTGLLVEESIYSYEFFWPLVTARA